MAEILHFPARNLLACDKCGCLAHYVRFEREGDVQLISCFECTN